MNILFRFGKKQRLVNDREELTNIILSMDVVQNIVYDVNYEEKAEKIAKGFESFRRIRKAHKNIFFQYDDILESEFNLYHGGHVPSICNFTGQKLLTPFDQLKNACQVVIKEDGTSIPYPEELRLGNKSTGQAYLPDGTEVFSPRHALAQSIKSSAHMLRSWAINFQERMDQEKC